MAEETNPYLAMSPAERERQQKLLDYAIAADGAKLDVAAAFLLKWAVSRLKGADGKPGKLGEALSAVSPQSFPKESLMGKPADLSETQIDAIKKAVLAAVEKAAQV